MNKTNYQIILPKSKSNEKSRSIRKSTYHKKQRKKNIKQEELKMQDQLKSNFKKMGVFHYDSITLIELSTLCEHKDLFQTEFQFYVPFKIINFENEKVTNRNIWVSDNKTYSSNSDLVPIIIHSSNYIPNKTKLKSTPLGAIIGVTYLNSKPPMYNMKRKNGIRSRYSSKQTGFVVKICSFQFLLNKSDLPKVFINKSFFGNEKEIKDENNNTTTTTTTTTTTNPNKTNTNTNTNTKNNESNNNKILDYNLKDHIQDENKIAKPIDLFKFDKNLIKQNQMEFKLISNETLNTIEINKFLNFNPLEQEMQSNYDLNFDFDFDLNFDYDFDNNSNYEFQFEMDGYNFDLDTMLLDNFNTSYENKHFHGKRLRNETLPTKNHKRFIRD
ncbi:mansc domain containing protein [Anaeramoeba flamelloides]|uniref:Mansc domain containing protein n=1 Tax=Anaeramoeba flamelloides TaxID=1746091 RepID=A0AAV7YMY2_9EUKA|nr:mansc domain containing protein [Anaeramoeba flamelloides]